MEVQSIEKQLQAPPTTNIQINPEDLSNNDERRARRILQRTLGMNNKQFKKFNKRSRQQGGNFFSYSSKIKKYIAVIG